MINRQTVFASKLANLIVMFLVLGVFQVNAQCTIIPSGTPTVSLGFVQSGGTNASGVAYNPNFNIYYAGIAGNPGFPLETFDAAGTPLFQTNTGFDIRGLWWNFNLNQLEANGYNAFGVWTFNLNGVGHAQNTGSSVFTGMNQPTAQSVGDYNCVEDEIWYYNAGTIQKRNHANGALISTLTIIGLPVGTGNLNNNSVFYTDCLGHEIGLVDYQLKRIYFADKTTGAYSGMSQLPAATVINNSFRASWANGMVFLYNVANRTWFGFQVLTGFNTNCSVVTCTPPVLITDDLVDCSPNMVDLNTGINAGSGIGNAQFYANLANANGSMSPISNMVSASGTYYVSYEDPIDASCFSVDSILVTINPIYNIVENINACENSMVTYPDGSAATITVSTSYTSNLTTGSGCDSIIVTNVTMDPDYNIVENINACENSMVTYPDGSTATITASTSYTSNLTTVAAGCDSIIVTNITMNATYNLVEAIGACENSTVTYPDGSTELIIASTSHTSNLTTIAGCDSIIVTNVTISFSSTSTVNETVCFGVQYTSPQGNSYGPGSFIETLLSAVGCDSVVTYVVTEIPLIVTTIDENVCFGEQYTSPNGTVYEGGIYVETFTAASGCDSTVTINVVEFSPINASFFISEQNLTTLNTDVTFVNTTNGINSYTWTFGDDSQQSSEESPVHTYPYFDSTSYTVMLIAVNQAGCSDTVIQRIHFEEELIYFVPNTFTPDGDALNNTFEPVFTSGFDPFDYSLLIFNRWGQIIFESHDATIGWDGTYKGRYVQDGTYTWKLEFKSSSSDERKIDVGHVIMMR